MTAEKLWQINPPRPGERFDASALLHRKKDELLTLNESSSSLYRIDLSGKASEANLIPVPGCFNEIQFASSDSKNISHYDREGLAEDSTRRIYVCDERKRQIFRCDPKTGQSELIEIDWAPVANFFHKSDPNAGFEGIAVGKGKLFVANERQHGRIFVVHLKTRKIIDHFTVRPSRTNVKDTHYSDLCWFEDSLFALLRENHVIVKIDPKTHRILAEYDFRQAVRANDAEYEGTYATMEGLAVNENYFWLITDNNGRSRKNFPGDTRPTLFRCRRPDR